MEQTPSQEQYVDDLSFQNEDILPGATWHAPEYHHTEHTKDWFWGLGIVAATITIISFLLGNWLFGVLVIIAGFSLAMFAHRSPRIVTIHLGSSGIMIEKTLYDFSDIESFWVEVEENPSHPRIIFKSKHLFMPYILIPLGDMHPEEVADFLSAFLPEVELKEPLLQRIAEDFGF